MFNFPALHFTPCHERDPARHPKLCRHMLSIVIRLIRILLIRLANRRCERFSGQEVGLSIAPPISKEDAALYLDDLHDLHGLDVWCDRLYVYIYIYTVCVYIYIHNHKSDCRYRQSNEMDQSRVCKIVLVVMPIKPRSSSSRRHSTSFASAERQKGDNIIPGEEDQQDRVCHGDEWTEFFLDIWNTTAN